jgi:enoyl-CoA hydratase/carnithine racemase
MPEIDYGLTPGWGGCTRMQRVVGRRRAREINLLGYEFSGRQAAEWNFVNRLVEPDQLENEVAELTGLVLAKSRFAVRRTKYVLRNASDGPISTAAAFELPIDAGAGPREVDGFASFTNKTSGLMDLRKRSSSMWADQRV